MSIKGFMVTSSVIPYSAPVAFTFRQTIYMNLDEIQAHVHLKVTAGHEAYSVAALPHFESQIQITFVFQTDLLSLPRDMMTHKGIWIKVVKTCRF